MVWTCRTNAARRLPTAGFISNCSPSVLASRASCLTKPLKQNLARLRRGKMKKKNWRQHNTEKKKQRDNRHAMTDYRTSMMQEEIDDYAKGQNPANLGRHWAAFHQRKSADLQRQAAQSQCPKARKRRHLQSGDRRNP